jgi:hypothetical protein
VFKVRSSAKRDTDVRVNHALAEKLVRCERAQRGGGVAMAPDVDDAR